MTTSHKKRTTNPRPSLGRSSIVAESAGWLSSRLEHLVPDFLETLSHDGEFQGSVKRTMAQGAPDLQSAVGPADQPSLFERMRAGRAPAGLAGYAGRGSTRVANYHCSKRREFDFVVMVVDPQGESSRTPLDEARRVFNVCATRAKRCLACSYYRNELGRVLGARTSTRVEFLDHVPAHRHGLLAGSASEILLEEAATDG